MSEPEKDPAREKSAAAEKRRSFVAALISDQGGVIIVLFALMLPILLGFMGLGVEVGYWYSKHRELQAAADAAALAASYEIAEGRPADSLTVATAEATTNGWTAAEGTITVRGDQYNSTFPATGNYTTDSDAVEVVLTLNVARMFSAYFISDDMTLDARAVGKSVAGANTACVLALGSGLSPGASAITSTGGASVAMTGCVVATNSTNSAAIKLSGGGTISADCVYSGGGVSGTPTTTACSGAKENQPAVEDPYADIPQPTFSSCSNPADKYSLTGSSADTLTEDVYCSISSSSSGTLTLNSGTYFLDGGDFKISGSGNVEATDVTIILGDSSGGSSCGNVSITGSGEIDMTAPTSGTYSGILFFRHASCSGTGQDMSFSGNSNSTVIGAIYSPSKGLSVTGGTSITGSCLQLIANTISFSGSGTIGSECDSAGTSDILAGGKGSLVE